jgi:manganese oxidase
MSDTPIDEEARLDALERDLQRYRVSRDGWTILVLAVGFLAALGSFIAIGFAMRGDDDGGASAVSAEPVEADLSEFAIDLSTSTISSPRTITVRNNGTMVHNIAVRDTALVSPDVEAGETADLDISSLEPGTYEIFCTIPGHTESGMSAQLTIGGEGAAVEAGAAAAGADHADHADHTPTAEEGAAQDQAMIESVLAFPAATEGLGNQPLSPQVLPDGTKRFELTASVVDWEVRPGEIVKAWAYNGTVPGPRIDLDVGDHVQVELTNQLPIGTDIHWHGVDVPNDQTACRPSRSTWSPAVRPTPTSSRSPSRPLRCTTPTPTPTRPSPMGSSERCTSATSQTPPVRRSRASRSPPT